MVLTTGYCKYCGNPTNVEAPEEAEQAIVDRLATEACGCPMAETVRKRKKQAERAQKIIFSICDDAFPDAVKPLTDAVQGIQTGKIEDISIAMAEGVRIRMKRTKTGMAVTVEHKQKEERQI